MSSEPARINLQLLIGCFGLAALVLVLRSISSGAPLINDADDAMRLVEVRDFLAGQGWYDLVQHRLNTPFGASIHWSRLVDLPIAGLILAFTPLLGPTGAELAAAYVYPLVMLFGLLWLSARLSVRLAGPDGVLPGLLLPIFSLVIFADFPPGRFDHHSAQILLLLALVNFTLAALARPPLAAGAGLAAAFGLAVGIESLPGIAAAILALGLSWVIDARQAAALRWFGVSFAGGTLVLLALALPPEHWLTPACDAISIVYAAAALGTGLVFAALSLLPLTKPLERLLAGLVGGALLLAALALLFPACLHGPYAALDPWLVRNWLDRIEEARPALAVLFDNPAYVIAVGLPPLLAVLVTIRQLITAPAAERGRWIAYATFLAVAVLVMLLQVRAARMAATLAVPAGAVLIVMARARYLATRRPLAVAGLVGAWLGFTGIALALVVQALTNLVPQPPPAAMFVAGRESDCRQPSAFAALATLQPQRLMAPIDLGSHLLAFTPHQVVAAPYHRDQDGVRDTFDFFNRPVAEAHAIAERRGITRLVVCPAMIEMRGLPDAAPDSLVRLLPAGPLPGWLNEESVPGAPLRVFAVS